MHANHGRETVSIPLLPFATPILALLLVGLWAPSELFAGGSEDAAEAKVISLTIHPAGIPEPALRFRLLPSLVERHRGNALALYQKAFLTAAQSPSLGEDIDRIVKWLETSPESLPGDEVRGVLARYNSVLHQIEMAARRDRCDWELPIGEEENPYAILLPELMQARQLGRILALKARAQIAEGDFPGAIHTLQTGFALSRHLAEQPTLVAGLVAVAVAQLMTDQLQAWTEATDAPNLYWAITALPEPLVDLRAALEFEASGLYLLVPELRDVRTAHHTDQQWMALLAQVIRRLQGLMGDGPEDSPGLKQELSNLAKVAYLGAQAPRAKADLVRYGYDKEQVEKMPLGQVAVLHLVETYDRLRDRMFKWFHVPYPHARKGIEAAEAYIEQKGRPQELVPLASLLLPAVGRAQFVEVKYQRRLDVLRCVETLRDYAAEHDGRLPRSLGDVADVPIPLNPVTGEPFGYRLDGDTAVLDAGGEPEPGEEYWIRVAE